MLARLSSLKRLSVWGVLAVLAGTLVAVLPREASAAATLLVPQDFPTIQAAVNAADPGDTIKLNPRKYRETLVVTTNNLTITGRTGETRATIIDRPAQDLDEDAIDIDANGVRVQRLTIRNPSEDGIEGDGKNIQVSNVRVEGDVDDDCVNLDGSKALVRNSVFNACEGDGVDLEGGSHSMILNNHVFIVDDCFEANGNDILITGNRGRACDEDGVDADGRDLVVSNNVFRSTDSEGLEVDGENPVVRNNLVVGAGSGGFDIFCTDRAGGVGAAKACATGAVAGNTSRGGTSHDDGFQIDADHRNFVVRDNKSTDAGHDGFNIDTDRAVIGGNVASRNGIDSSEQGFDIDGDDNRITNNVATRNQSQGFEVDGDSNLLRNNRAVDNNSDGLNVGGNRNLLRSNTAIDNSTDGIENDGTNTRLIENNSRDNRRNRDCVNDGTIAVRKRNNCADGSNFKTDSSGIDKPVV